MNNNLSYHDLLTLNDALIKKCKNNNIDITDIIDFTSNENEDFTNIYNQSKYSNLFKVIFEKSPVGIFLFNNQSVILESNTKFSELIGTDKEKILNINILKFIENTEVKNAISKCLSNQSAIYSGEYVSLSGNKTSYIKLFLSPLTDNNNNVIGGIGLAEDYTFQKKHEDELIHAKAQQRALLDNLPAIAWFKDINGVYLSINQAFCDLNNRDFKQIIGKTDHDIWYDKLANSVLQEDFKIITQSKTINYEIEFVNNEGRKYLLDIFKTPVFDQNKNIVGTTGYATDISIKKKNELDLKTEKIYFENLFNNSPEAIAIADINSNVLRINKQFTKMFQFSEEEIIGRNIDELISDENDVEFAHSITQQIQFGKNSAFEAVRLKKDRTKIEVVILGVPLTLSDGSIVIYGIYQDISKQKAEQHELIIAKEKAIESDKLKTNFLANMSHELRTPLNGILGFSELLLSEDLNEEVMEMVQSVYQSGNRLLETINSILDISIIEANKLNINIKEENIAEIIQETIKKYLPKSEEKNIQIIFDFKGKAIINTDKKIFGNIVNRLLDNALKYTKKGSVKINLSKESSDNKSFLVLTISDTGIGIEKENFEKIFQYFSQVSEGYTRAYEGSGLGLSITKHYVEILEGTISLESILNVGSCFTVKIPIKESDILNFNINASGSFLLKPLILLVEDEKTNAEYVILSLRKEYEIDLATNGNEAIEMTSKKLYNLILMDINLGRDLNGIVATNEIRKLSDYQNIPIIAVTANAMAGQKEELLSQGLTDYISKPFRRDMLLKVIKTNLSH